MLDAAKAGALDVLFLLGADEIDTTVLGSTFVVYQGTLGDAGAHRADVVLPAAAYTEKSATYVNTEGRAQMTAKAATPPGVAKDDWSILRALSASCGQTLPYDDIATLRAAMYKAAPQLARLGTVAPASAATTLAGLTGQVAQAPFVNPIRDYYLTNPIARASAVMADMSALKKNSTGAALDAAE